VQDIILKADSHSSCQKYPAFFMEPEGSLQCSQKPTIRPYPEPAESRISPGPRRFETFRNNKHFLLWGVVAPRPTPQVGGPPIVGCPRLLIRYIRSYPA
jgi:hypothetical protein